MQNFVILWINRFFRLKRCQQLVRKALIIGYLHITKNMDLVCNRAKSILNERSLFRICRTDDKRILYKGQRKIESLAVTESMTVYSYHMIIKKSPWASLDIFANLVSSLALWLFFRLGNGTPHEMIVLLFPDFQLFICVLKKHKFVMRKPD